MAGSPVIAEMNLADNKRWTSNEQIPPKHIRAFIGKWRSEGYGIQIVQNVWRKETYGKYAGVESISAFELPPSPAQGAAESEAG